MMFDLTSSSYSTSIVQHCHTSDPSPSSSQAGYPRGGCRWDWPWEASQLQPPWHSVWTMHSLMPTYFVPNSVRLGQQTGNDVEKMGQSISSNTHFGAFHQINTGWCVNTLGNVAQPLQSHLSINFNPIVSFHTCFSRARHWKEIKWSVGANFEPLKWLIQNQSVNAQIPIWNQPLTAHWHTNLSPLHPISPMVSSLWKSTAKLCLMLLLSRLLMFTKHAAKGMGSFPQKFMCRFEVGCVNYVFL